MPNASIIAACFIILSVYCVSSPVRAHKDHENIHAGLNKERVKDGHYKDGEHQDNYDHEAVLGSKEKAQEFDDLPAEEAKKRLRTLVTKGGMDVNGDGVVSKEELTEWIKDSFHSMARDDAAERLKEDDTDGDGLVTWEEYIKDNFDSNPDAEDAELMKEDRILFDSADTNGDGALNTEEYAAFNTPEEYEQMHGGLYKIAMTKRDKNGDGFLDLQEFLADDNGDMPEGDENEAEKFKFEEYDLDKDGKLNEKEVSAWIIPDTRDMAIGETEHLIKSADDDGNGELTVDEIVNNHDIFVGSEATDFGEKLKVGHEEL